jgi:hypothetical protein
MELRLLTDCLYGYLKAEKTALNLYWGSGRFF